VLSGRTIGLFGVTSSDKSSTINALIGSPVAKVGVGETTRDITAYDGRGYRLYDTPGINDDFPYFSEEYIALMKGLTHRPVLITTTVKQVTKLLHLFGAVGLHYNIVINKFDAVDTDEREDFREQILEEIEECQLENMNHL
jgi:GTP-binding protein EngB required for normal cell division